MLTELEKVAIEPEVRRSEVVMRRIRHESRQEAEVVPSFVSNQITDYIN